MKGLTLEQLIDELHLLRLETVGIDPKIGFDSKALFYKVYVTSRIFFRHKNLKMALREAIQYIRNNRKPRREKVRGKDYIFNSK